MLIAVYYASLCISFPQTTQCDAMTAAKSFIDVIVTLQAMLLCESRELDLLIAYLKMSYFIKFKMALSLFVI